MDHSLTRTYETLIVHHIPLVHRAISTNHNTLNMGKRPSLYGLPDLSSSGTISWPGRRRDRSHSLPSRDCSVGNNTLIARDNHSLNKLKSKDLQEGCDPLMSHDNENINSPCFGQGSTPGTEVGCSNTNRRSRADHVGHGKARRRPFRASSCPTGQNDNDVRLKRHSLQHHRTDHPVMRYVNSLDGETERHSLHFTHESLEETEEELDNEQNDKYLLTDKETDSHLCDTKQMPMPEGYPCPSKNSVDFDGQSTESVSKNLCTEDNDISSSVWLSFSSASKSQFEDKNSQQCDRRLDSCYITCSDISCCICSTHERDISSQEDLVAEEFDCFGEEKSNLYEQQRAAICSSSSMQWSPLESESFYLDLQSSPCDSQPLLSSSEAESFTSCPQLTSPAENDGKDSNCNVQGLYHEEVDLGSEVEEVLPPPNDLRGDARLVQAMQNYYRLVTVDLSAHSTPIGTAPCSSAESSASSEELYLPSVTPVSEYYLFEHPTPSGNVNHHDDGDKTDNHVNLEDDNIVESIHESANAVIKQINFSVAKNHSVNDEDPDFHALDVAQWKEPMDGKVVCQCSMNKLSKTKETTTSEAKGAKTPDLTTWVARSKALGDVKKEASSFALSQLQSEPTPNWIDQIKEASSILNTPTCKPGEVSTSHRQRSRSYDQSLCKKPLQGVVSFERLLSCPSHLSSELASRESTPQKCVTSFAKIARAKKKGLGTSPPVSKHNELASLQISPVEEAPPVSHGSPGLQHASTGSHSSLGGDCCVFEGLQREVAKGTEDVFNTTNQCSPCQNMPVTGGACKQHSLQDELSSTHKSKVKVPVQGDSNSMNKKQNFWFNEKSAVDKTRRQQLEDASENLSEEHQLLTDPTLPEVFSKSHRPTTLPIQPFILHHNFSRSRSSCPTQVPRQCFQQSATLASDLPVRLVDGQPHGAKVATFEHCDRVPVKEKSEHSSSPDSYRSNEESSNNLQHMPGKGDGALLTRHVQGCSCENCIGVGGNPFNRSPQQQHQLRWPSPPRGRPPSLLGSLSPINGDSFSLVSPQKTKWPEQLLPPPHSSSYSPKHCASPAGAIEETKVFTTLLETSRPTTNNHTQHPLCVDRGSSSTIQQDASKCSNSAAEPRSTDKRIVKLRSPAELLAIRVGSSWSSQPSQAASEDPLCQCTTTNHSDVRVRNREECTAFLKECSCGTVQHTPLRWPEREVSKNYKATSVRSYNCQEADHGLSIPQLHSFLKDFNPEYFSMVEKPPEEFCLSPEASTMSLSMDVSEKRGLVQAVNSAVDLVVAHFGTTRDPGLKAKMGDSAICPNVGHLLLKYLCPAIAGALGDGLRPFQLDFIVGRRKNSLWHVVEASTQPGTSTKALNALYSQLSQMLELSTNTMRFNAFIFGLLNLCCLDTWLSHLHEQEGVVNAYYQTGSLLDRSHPPCVPLFEEILLLLQPLVLLPFKLDLVFEFCTKQRRQEQIAQRERLHSQFGLQRSLHSTLQLMLNWGTNSSSESSLPPTNIGDIAHQMEDQNVEKKQKVSASENDPANNLRTISNHSRLKDGVGNHSKEEDENQLPCGVKNVEYDESNDGKAVLGERKHINPAFDKAVKHKELSIIGNAKTCPCDGRSIENDGSFDNGTNSLSSHISVQSDKILCNTNTIYMPETPGRDVDWWEQLKESSQMYLTSASQGNEPLQAVWSKYLDLYRKVYKTVETKWQSNEVTNNYKAERNVTEQSQNNNKSEELSRNVQGSKSPCDDQLQNVTSVDCGNVAHVSNPVDSPPVSEFHSSGADGIDVLNVEDKGLWLKHLFGAGPKAVKGTSLQPERVHPQLNTMAPSRWLGLSITKIGLARERLWTFGSTPNINNNVEAREEEKSQESLPDSKLPCGEVKAVCDQPTTDPDHLCFPKGAILKVISNIDSNWIMCTFEGKSGLVPVAYITHFDDADY
uniref:AP-4 complex accessory subunit RUSC2-like isoform X2 n=1 Tax=Myxine glutinosa TaxID=7769 RepID=UPI00358F36C3